jgi:hypothetical protein
MPHTHICKSKFHEGARQRQHYDDRCTEPRETDCLPCGDIELEAQGATWETGDEPFSDADPGL